MATNIDYMSGDGGVTRRLTVPSTVVANDLVELNDLHALAITSYSAEDGKADLKMPGIMLVASLSVLAEDNSGGSAVALGQKLYYDAAETPDEINKDATAGKLIGYALEAIASGETATIEVALVQS